MSRPSAERQSRTEREPGPRAHDGKFPSICRVAPGSGSSLADARSAGTRERGRAHATLVGSLYEPSAVNSSHDVKQRSIVRSRGALLRPGSRLPFASTPRGVGGAPTGALSLLSRLRDATDPRLVRRGASHDAGRSPLGAPPWRFSAGGRASISGIASGSVQRAPRSQVVMPGGRCPGPPEPAVTSRGRRTPLPAPPFRTVSGRRPSMSEDGKSYISTSLRSQYHIRHVVI